MTLIEILKAKGISEDIIKAVQDDMKTNNIFTASEENLDVRYGKLKTQHESASAQLKEANNLIAELKKSTEGQGEVQQKVAGYEQQIATLQAELKQAQIDGEVNVALLSAGVKPDDIDYVTFKLKAKGELELDEQGKIKGMDDKIAALKTQLPAQFAADNSKKNVLENKLPNEHEGSNGVTSEAFAKMGYQDRLKLYQDNPETYKQLTQK